MRIPLTSELPRRRAGFTLVELLVVIAIIVILAALIAAAVFYWVPAQQRRNTEGMMRDVNKLLQVHWSWVVERAKKEAPSPAVRFLAGSDPTGERAKVLWVKVRLMEAFPITYAEVNGSGNVAQPDPVNTFLYNTQFPPNSGQFVIPPGQQKYLKSYRNTLGGGALFQDTTGQSITESSACLLMALSVARGGAVFSGDNLGTFVQDTDQDGVSEIVDAWRSPIAFYRFAWNIPGGTPDIQGLNPAPGSFANPPATWSKGFKLGDPLDPGGLLTSWQPSSAGTPRAIYTSLFHPITVPTGNATVPAIATYVIPVLVSAGPDTQLGSQFGLPMPSQCAGNGLAATAATYANGAPCVADNIFSFNLKGN